MPNYTKIEELMDLDDIFSDKGRGSHSMDGMPPHPNRQPFQQQMITENFERQKQAKPLEGKLRNNVNMARAINGGSGSIYPSMPQMHSPPEYTNPNLYDTTNIDIMDAQNYKLGPKAYSSRKPGNNSYESLVEGYKEYRDDFNCIDVANHIKNCPICSKFYDNDKSMYVVAIIVLIIICIILARKVLENYEK
jgi:hypothetical protein